MTVLANVLRRPISIYELASTSVSVTYGNAVNDVQPIVCKGVFGADSFEDPLLDIPESAVLQVGSHPVGAFSWHLHILVVDVSVDEKHACVLLPHQQLK